MILLIDNYDSFTYNLVQHLEELGKEVQVRFNDTLDIEDIPALNPTAIILSPGPSAPQDAGITVEVVRRYHQQVPILGVCLGHQAIAFALGAKVVRAGQPVHGKVSYVFHDGQGVYRRVENPFQAVRYHSLTVREESLPASLMVTARTVNGEVMGIRHRCYPVEGVQFHPESFLTLNGKMILRNFLYHVAVGQARRLATHSLR